MKVRCYDCDGTNPFRAAVDSTGMVHFALRFEVAKPIRRLERRRPRNLLEPRGAFWIVASADGVTVKYACLRSREETNVFASAVNEAFAAHQRIVFGLQPLGIGDYPAYLMPEIQDVVDLIAEVSEMDPEALES